MVIVLVVGVFDSVVAVGYVVVVDVFIIAVVFEVNDVAGDVIVDGFDAVPEIVVFVEEDIVVKSIVHKNSSMS